MKQIVIISILSFLAGTAAAQEITRTFNLTGKSYILVVNQNPDGTKTTTVKRSDGSVFVPPVSLNPFTYTQFHAALADSLYSDQKSQHAGSLTASQEQEVNEAISDQTKLLFFDSIANLLVSPDEVGPVAGIATIKSRVRFYRAESRNISAEKGRRLTRRLEKLRIDSLKKAPTSQRPYTIINPSGSQERIIRLNRSAARRNDKIKSIRSLLKYVELSNPDFIRRVATRQDSIRQGSLRQSLVRRDSVRRDSIQRAYMRRSLVRQDSILQQLTQRDSVRRDSTLRVMKRLDATRQGRTRSKQPRRITTLQDSVGNQITLQMMSRRDSVRRSLTLETARRQDSIRLDSALRLVSHQDSIRHKLTIQRIARQDSIRRDTLPKVKTVQLEVLEGFLENVSAVIEDRTATRVFTNQFGIGFASKNNISNLYNYWLLEKGKPYDRALKVNLGELLDYRIQHEPGRRDYSPKDNSYYFDATEQPMSLRKDATKRLLEARIYSDFVGLDEKNPNGLVQIEVTKRINTNTNRALAFRKQWWLNDAFRFVLGSGVGMLQYVIPSTSTLYDMA